MSTSRCLYYDICTLLNVFIILLRNNRSFDCYYFCLKRAGYILKSTLSLHFNRNEIYMFLFFFAEILGASVKLSVLKT